MEDDSWEYGAGEEIDQKILDDYESPDFDISEVVDDYDSEDLSNVSEKGGDSEDSFINPDEKLKDWDFDGLQVEKHSKGSRRKRKKKEREAAESQAAEVKKKDEEDPETDYAKAAEEIRKAGEEGAAGEAQKAEEEKETGEAVEAGEEKETLESREAEEARKAEEAKRAEEEQQAAFERISKTVQAPIASSLIGDTPDEKEVSGEEFHVVNNGEESHGD